MRRKHDELAQSRGTTITTIIQRVVLSDCEVAPNAFLAGIQRADLGRPGLPGGRKVNPMYCAKFFTAS
jgi:hypothetical protein